MLMTKSSTTTKTKTTATVISCLKSQLVSTSTSFPSIASMKLRMTSMSCNRFFNRQSLLIFLAALLFLCSLQIPVIRGAFEDGNNNNVKITEQSLELTQTINMQRQEYMQKQCETLGYNILDLSDLTEQQMEHMIVDRKHKLLYCYVPKVACTNWKRVLLLMNGDWHNGTNPLEIPGHVVHAEGVFKNLSSLNDTERNQIFSEYTRFLIVRHPFERLLSAYRNKLEGRTASARYFQRRIGRQIIKAFRVNPSNHSLTHGDDVTFAEFIQYLLTPELSLSNQSNYNEHWEPITKLCNPCIMKYNLLGKFETLLDDSALALYLAGADHLTFPTGHKPSSTRKQLRKYFDPLSISAIRRLYEIYAEDFRLFDYSLEDVLGFEFG